MVLGRNTLHPTSKYFNSMLGVKVVKNTAVYSCSHNHSDFACIASCQTSPKQQKWSGTGSLPFHKWEVKQLKKLFGIASCKSQDVVMNTQLCPFCMFTLLCRSEVLSQLSQAVESSFVYFVLFVRNAPLTTCVILEKSDRELHLQTHDQYFDLHKVILFNYIGKTLS